MRILTLNCGSSTLKFDLFELGGAQDASLGRVAQGEVDRIGPDASCSLTIGAEQRPSHRKSLTDQAAALREAASMLQAEGLLAGLDCVAHRIVHGGPDLQAPVRIDDDVVSRIEAASELAPLHNAPALAALKASRQVLGDVTMVACFDTAFYSSLPEVAREYALPRQLVSRLAIRRYGFHGLAHQFMVERYRQLRPDLASPRLVSFQLGNGCSITASAAGRAIDTSMGFTPLEGLVMGTRSGDLDPALPLYIAEREHLTPDEVEALLNRRSGLLGLSGRSSDMRDLEEAAGRGDAGAALAIDAFCYRARKYLGAYLAALGGADAVLFGGGIGEHSALVRARICDGMAWAAGIEVDGALNAAASGIEARISVAGRVDVWVLPVDEASVMARESLRVLRDAG